MIGDSEHVEVKVVAEQAEHKFSLPRSHIRITIRLHIIFSVFFLKILHRQQTEVSVSD